MHRVLTSFLSLLYFTAIRANAQDTTLISAAAPTTTFSTDVPTTDFDVSSIISSELASLYPSTNPYARACLTYNSVVDKCNFIVATLTAPAAIESGATSCYCEISSSLHNGAFEAILSSCEIYISTAHLFTTSQLTETYTPLSTPSASSVPLLSFSSPTSVASVLPKSIVCNGPATTATATATGGTSSTPTTGATITSGESTASGSSASAASGNASVAAANALLVGDLKTSFGTLILGLFALLRLF